MLDIWCIEAGRLQWVLEPVEVAELATDCLGLMQPMAQLRRVVLALGFEAQARGWRVQADPTRLRQVLINLLSNAIKFNREAGQVRLSAHWDGEFLVVEVADEGPGIPPAQLPRLFQAFERLDLVGAVEGTGIGLALSRQLAELMGGEIGVRSEPGRGSVFWLRLPGVGDPARAPVPAEPVHSSVSQARHSVLYIEDNPVNLVLMQGMLGHRPSIDLLLAELPEQGLAMAAQHPPDLVLLDIQLPGIDGFEVLRRLRTLPLLGAVPVVAVSANAMPDDVALEAVGVCRLPRQAGGHAGVVGAGGLLAGFSAGLSGCAGMEGRKCLSRSSCSVISQANVDRRKGLGLGDLQQMLA